jgi:protease IV
MENVQTTQSPQKKSSSKWFWGILLSFAVIVVVLLIVSITLIYNALKYKTEYHTGGSGEKIALIELNDVIMSSESMVEEIKKFREDKSIKAIVLRINSPGGGVAASQEIYEEVKKTRDKGKIIVVSMGSIAASGGYYIACGSSLIVANPGTLTGSIGVIAQFYTIKDLADKLGIKQQVIKSGELKDAGNPFRDMNDKDKEYFQDVVDNSFGQFLGVVAKERKMNPDSLKKYSNGRVFTGLQAKEIGLIDSLGTLEDAIRITAKMAGIDDEPRVVKLKKRTSLFQFFLENEFEEIKDIKQKFFEEPILQYKLTP